MFYWQQLIWLVIVTYLIVNTFNVFVVVNYKWILIMIWTYDSNHMVNIALLKLDPIPTPTL